MRRSEDGFTLVELLVVMVLMGVVMAATLSVITATTRSNRYGEQLRRVMDDGRISIERVRGELRGGRRVLAGSNAYKLRWWVDQDQNGSPSPSELVNYCVAPLSATSGTACLTSAPSTGTQWKLLSWTDAAGPASARTIARTLVDPEVFSGYAPTITETQTVTVTYVLDVTDDGFGPDDITMTADVRLRNVAY